MINLLLLAAARAATTRIRESEIQRQQDAEKLLREVEAYLTEHDSEYAAAHREIAAMNAQHALYHRRCWFYFLVSVVGFYLLPKPIPLGLNYVAWLGGAYLWFRTFTAGGQLRVREGKLRNWIYERTKRYVESL